MTTHYIYGPNTPTTACGLRRLIKYTGERLWPFPMHKKSICVECTACQNSEIYKLHQMHAELVFEGALTESWTRAWHHDLLPKL